MAAHIIRDSAGRITNYAAKEAPSNTRLREIIRQAEKSGAKKVGLVADVQNFQAYEDKEGHRQLVRDYRNTPSNLLARFSGKEHVGSMHATSGVLSEVQTAAGAEHASGLRGFTLNFIY